MAFGIDNQVLAQLVAGAVLDEQARKLGLGVSKDRLAQLAREDPAFEGPSGTFDRQQFEQVLRQVGMTAGGLSAQSSAGRRSPADRRGDFRRAGSARRFPRGGGALSRRGSHDRLCRRPAIARRADRGARRVCSQGVVRGAQGDLCRAGISQDRLHQARSGSAGRSVGDQRRAGEEGLRRARLPLHHAGNPQGRAAHPSEPGGRQGGL